METVAQGQDCPLCRQPLRQADLHNACSDEEAAVNASLNANSGEFGAKVGLQPICAPMFSWQ